MVLAETYPVALEAVLGAEVALLALLLAVWTLQLARVLVAVFARALARGGRVSGHGDGRAGEKRLRLSYARWLGQRESGREEASRPSVAIVPGFLHAGAPRCLPPKKSPTYQTP